MKERSSQPWVLREQAGWCEACRTWWRGPAPPGELHSGAWAGDCSGRHPL